MAIDQHEHGNPKFWPCSDACLRLMLLKAMEARLARRERRPEQRGEGAG